MGTYGTAPELSLNDYPDLKGIETESCSLGLTCGTRLNDYPDLKGIETGRRIVICPNQV